MCPLFGGSAVVSNVGTYLEVGGNQGWSQSPGEPAEMS